MEEWLGGQKRIVDNNRYIESMTEQVDIITEGQAQVRSRESSTTCFHCFQVISAEPSQVLDEIVLNDEAHVKATYGTIRESVVFSVLWVHAHEGGRTPFTLPDEHVTV